MKAIIMAGGSGTRLRPLTSEFPKPLAPVAGRSCIEHIIDLLKKYDINDIAATVMYKKEMIENHLENESVTFFEETKPLGTAGSIKNCEKFLDSDFIVISGDAICDFDLSKAVDFHYSHGGIATIVLADVTDPLEYGVCVLDEDNKITRFIEKPSWERAYSNTVNTGIYIFSREILDYIDKGKPSDFSKDVFPMLMKKNIKIHGYTAEGYWCDIGSLQSYLKCNMDALSGKAGIQFKSSSPIGSANIIQPSYIGKNVECDDCTIGPYAVIGDNVKISKNSRIEKSVVLNDVTVGEDCCIRNAVICGKTKIGKDSSIGDYSVIGSSCIVGNSCVVAAESRVYPKNILPDESVINGNITEGYKRFTLNMSRTELNQKLSSLSNMGFAVGSIFKGNIAVGHEDCTEMSQNFAVISGVLSASANVIDLGECDRNALRYTVREYGLNAGVYIGCDNIYLYESDGLPLSRDKERAFDSTYSMNDAVCKESGKYRTLKGYMKVYESKLKRYLINIKPICAHLYAPEFLSSLIETKTNQNSERIYVGDELGVDDYPAEIVQCAVSMAYGMTYGRVYIPYTFPGIIEKIGENYKFEVCRLTLEDKDRRLLYDMTDPNVMGAVLARYMSKNNLTFEALMSKIPPVYIMSRDIDCSENKCSVMKRLSTMPDREKELVEGVRFYDKENGRSVLIIPKRDLFGFRIIAEAANTEAAGEICDFYVKTIKSKNSNIDKHE